jgi:hypothetical protein
MLLHSGGETHWPENPDLEHLLRELLHGETAGPASVKV